MPAALFDAPEGFDPAAEFGAPMGNFDPAAEFGAPMEDFDPAAEFGSPVEDFDPVAEFGPPEGQTPAETAARSFGQNVSSLALKGVQGIGQWFEDLSAAADKVMPGLGDVLDYAPQSALFQAMKPVAEDLSQEAEAVYQPDAERNPIAATFGGGLGQAVGMIPMIATGGTPLVLGAAASSGYGEGSKTAAELGVENPAGRMALGVGFGVAETLVERLGGVGAGPVRAAGREVIEGLAKRTLNTIGSETFEEPITGQLQDLGSTLAAKAVEDPNRPGYTVTGESIADLQPDSAAYWKRRGLEAVGGAAGGTVFAGLGLLAGSPQGETSVEGALPGVVPPPPTAQVEVDGQQWNYQSGALTPEQVKEATPEVRAQLQAAGLVSPVAVASQGEIDNSSGPSIVPNDATAETADSGSFEEALGDLRADSSPNAGERPTEAGDGPHRRLLQAQEKRGRVIDEAELENWEQIGGGNEHDVFFAPTNPEKVVKVTLPNLSLRNPQSVGVKRNLESYLNRWNLDSQAFGLKSRLLGVIDGGEGVRLAVEQDFVQAADPRDQHPKGKQVNDWLRAAGFEWQSGAWVRQEDGLVLTDEHDGNWIVTKEGMRPVDVQLSRLPDTKGSVLLWAETQRRLRAAGLEAVAPESTASGFQNTDVIGRRQDGSTIVFGELVDMAARAVRAGLDFATWAGQALKRFGESILNYLADAWRAAKRNSEVGARANLNPNARLSARLPTMAESLDGQVRESQFGERVQADERLTPELRARAPGQFAVQGDQMVMDQVAAVMREEGSLEAAGNRFREDASLPMPVRIAGLSRVALNYDAQAAAARATGGDTAAADRATEAAVAAVADLEEFGNEAGRNLRIFSLWARMSPDGQLRRLERGLNDANAETVRGDAGATPAEITAAINAELPAAQAEAEAEAKNQAPKRERENRRKLKEAVKKERKTLAQRTIDRLARLLSDTPDLRNRSAEDSALRQLIDEHMKTGVPDFATRAEALGVPAAEARTLDGLINEGRRRDAVAQRELLKERLLKRLLRRLQDKPRANVRLQKLPAVLETLMTAVAGGVVTEQQFLKAWVLKYELPTLSPADRTRLRDLAAKVNLLPEGVLRQKAAVEFMNELALIKGIPAVDALMAAWYANLLSGLSTQMINVGGNGMMLLLRSFTMVLASPREGVKYLRGLAEGLGAGRREAAAVLREGVGFRPGKFSEAQAVSALDLLMKKPGSKTLAEWLAFAASLGGITRIFPRLLGATDALFFHTAYEGMTHLATARALRQSGMRPGTPEFNAEFIRQLGGNEVQWAADLEQAAAELRQAGQVTPKVADVNRRAWELRRGRRTLETREKAQRWAERLTFTQKPEGEAAIMLDAILGSMQNFAPKGVPVGRMVLAPFRGIVVNVADALLDFSPWGIVRGLGTSRSTGKHTPKRLMDAVERRERVLTGLMGTGLAYAAYALAAAYMDDDDADVPFMLWGMGPTSPAARQLLMELGWRPYSMKIGGRYWSFAETPLAGVLGAVGHMLDSVRYDKSTNKTNGERAYLALMAGVQGFTRQGTLSQIGDAVDVMSGQKSPKSLMGTAIRPVTGFVPMQGMLRDVATVFDPRRISDEDIMGAMLKDLPFVKAMGTKPALNWKGEAVEFHGLPVVRRVTNGQRLDPDTLFLVRNGLTISKLPESILVGDFALPPAAQGTALVESYRRRGLALTALENGAMTEAQGYRFAQRAGQLTVEGVTRLRKSFETSYPQGKLPEALRPVAEQRVKAITEAARRMAMLEEVARVR